MRPRWMIVVAAVLAVGQVRGDEPAPTAPLAEAADPPTASVPESSGLLSRRPSLGSRLANWRPISRWLNRTSPSEEPVPIRAAENPDPPAAAPDGPAPPVPAMNPLEGDPGTTRPGPGDSTATPAGGPEEPRRGSEPISANPAAVDIVAGTGALGRLLGLDKDSGIRLGGLWIGDTSGILTGGQNPGTWAFNSLSIVDLNLNTEKLFGWTGGSFGIEFLQFAGQNTNGLAGAFPGFDSIEAGPPFVRNELYELWYRQGKVKESVWHKSRASVGQSASN